MIRGNNESIRIYHTNTIPFNHAGICVCAGVESDAHMIIRIHFTNLSHFIRYMTKHHWNNVNVLNRANGVSLDRMEWYYERECIKRGVDPYQTN